MEMETHALMSCSKTNMRVCVCLYGDGNTRIDVLWPAAISCQTVLTAPINDPNPPFMDEYKNKNQRRGTDFSFICVLLVFLLVLLVFLDLSADLESKLMTINNLQLIQYNPHNNWVTKCTFNTESIYQTNTNTKQYNTNTNPLLFKEKNVSPKCFGHF